jgi:hypothetical protein
VLAAFGVTFFLQGKAINENLDGWHDVYEKLATFFPQKPTFDLNGASILALEKVRSTLGRSPTSIHLIGYRQVTRWDLMDGGDPGRVTTIDPPPKRVTALSVYVFQIDADGRHFRVFVDGHNARLVEEFE